MKQSTLTTIMKALVISVIGLSLVLAAFGVGVGVGMSQRGAAVAQQARPTVVERPALTPTVASAAAAPAAAATAAAATAVPPPPATEGGTDSPEREPTPTPMPPVVPTQTRQNKEALPDQAPIDTELIDEAWKLLKEQFYGNLPEGDDVTYAAIRGIVASLGDRHTSFLDPEQAEISNTELQGEFEGIGAQVDLAPGGGVEIKHLFANQPAQKAGMLVGDVVLMVDGQDVTQMDLSEAVSLIRGPRGTKVTLTIQREEQPRFDLTITRARIELPLVESETLADGAIEYVALSQFSSNSPERLAEALNAAVAKEPQGIIFDLRDNSGGFLDASVRISSYFVPEGNILIERFADGEEKAYKRQGRYLMDGIPLVVLVNGGSASASEIVAGAIQDAGTGTLIGTTTYGKGSVQIPNSMSNGSQLRVTIARWYTPLDRGIDGTGLTPDVEVDDPTLEQLEADEDPQVARAIEFLLKGQ